MKKFLFAISLVFLLSFSVISATSANTDIIVYLDGKIVEFDVKPQIINGRTMVPIRAIFEKMGASVSWDQDNGSVICIKGGISVTMTVNSSVMEINNEKISMDVSPVIMDGRTLAPARFVAEAFGAEVQWSEKNNAVVICSEKVYAYTDYPDIPDIGKCFNAKMTGVSSGDGYKKLRYLSENNDNEGYYNYLYLNSMSVLGNYAENCYDNSNGIRRCYYVKPEDNAPRYYVTYEENVDGTVNIEVYIPDYYEPQASMVTLYALDGRTISVSKNEVSGYLSLGWYRTLEETKQTLYSADGKSISVYKAEVLSYKNAGWYESPADAAASQTINAENNTVTSGNNTLAPNPVKYYRTPTGKKYHTDPECGGKNSYPTTLQEARTADLLPCQKCV